MSEEKTLKEIEELRELISGLEGRIDYLEDELSSLKESMGVPP